MRIFSARKIIMRGITLTAAGIILFSTISVGQRRNPELREIDAYIRLADSLSMRSQTSFYLTKYLQDQRIYREHWHFFVDKDRIVVFEVNFIIDSVEFSEVYYVNRGRLVCSEEYEKVNYSFYEDELRWGGIYYFVSLEPRRSVFIGKKMRKEEEGDPANVALARFRTRYAELQRHLPMLPK